jgi:hypothetical protein
MSIVISLFILLISLLSGFVTGRGTSAQSKALDTASKNDINSLYQKLEEHYNEYGGYPTARDLTEEYDIVLPTLDVEALYDADGKIVNEGSYEYNPSNCSALYCQKYLLRATLEDGSVYEKTSLN